MMQMNAFIRCIGKKRALPWIFFIQVYNIELEGGALNLLLKSECANNQKLCYVSCLDEIKQEHS